MMSTLIRQIIHFLIFVFTLPFGLLYLLILNIHLRINKDKNIDIDFAVFDSISRTEWRSAAEIVVISNSKYSGKYRSLREKIIQNDVFIEVNSFEDGLIEAKFFTESDSKTGKDRNIYKFKIIGIWEPKPKKSYIKKRWELVINPI